MPGYNGSTEEAKIALAVQFSLLYRKESTMKNFLVFIIGLLTISVFLTVVAVAKSVEFTREYTYQASEADSKLTSRTIAIEQIKRLLLEELGTFLISRTEVRDALLTKDEIVSFTAGSVATIIITERWNGTEYYMKAQIKADPDQVTEAIVAIKKNEGDAEEMQQLRTKSNESLQEIERLRKEIAELKKNSSGANDEKMMKVQKEYDQTVAGLSAREITQQGASLLRDKKYPEAIGQFNKAIELDPKSIFPYVLRGSAFIQMKEYNKAINNSNQIIAAMPNEGVGYFHRGRTYLMMKQNDKAMDDLNVAISKRPKYFPPYALRGDILIRNKEYEKALENYNQAVAAMPNYPTPYFQRGRSYFFMKEYDKAMADFDAVLGLHSNHIGALMMKARVYSQRKESPQAIAELEKAAQLHKGDYGVSLELGRLYHQVKRYEDAVKIFSSAIKLKPSLTAAYMYRSQSYQVLRQNDKAMQDLEKAASLGNKMAQVQLERIKKGGVRKQYEAVGESISE
jgi:tetratricopeptide (TPR) repeat protein